MKEVETIKNLIDKLTQKSGSIFTMDLIFEAGEFGIGEQQVYHALDELKEQKYIDQPSRQTIEILTS